MSDSQPKTPETQTHFNMSQTTFEVLLRKERALPVVTTLQTKKANRSSALCSSPHRLLCLLDSLKFILHPNTRTWSMTTHKRRGTPTGVPYPHNLRGRGAWRKTLGLRQMRRGGEERRREIGIRVLENRGAEKSNRKKKEGERWKTRGGRERRVSACLTAALQQKKQVEEKQTERVKGYREMRGKREWHEREDREIKRGEMKADNTEKFVQLLFYHTRTSDV